MLQVFHLTEQMNREKVMNHHTKIFATILTIALLSAVQSAQAMVIAYEWTEGGQGNGTNSIFSSFHNATGPVLADDFMPAISGQVVQVDWWGSAGLVGASNSWEITFHNDNPAGTPSYPYISQNFLSASGSDPDGDGVLFFSAAWNPMDTLINAGTDYWFSVANASTNNWLWANAGGAAPTVGSELYDAVQSVGGMPSSIAGPHDGPWASTADNQDFGFRIWVVPEPSMLALFGLGLAGLGFSRRKIRI